MGANMQRQAVPLIHADAPIVSTGIEDRCAQDAGDVLLAEDDGEQSLTFRDQLISIDYSNARTQDTSTL
jgi:DNA-directed RNA polymerase beta subunit